MNHNNYTFDTFNDERQFDLDIFNFRSHKEFCLALNDFCFLRNFEKPNMAELIIKWGGVYHTFTFW